ncbi:MAG: DUF4175 family protein [Deferrisomatales bacterium]|nr:DUF4175 family protein [Deferrisomatales bacterium]
MSRMPAGEQLLDRVRRTRRRARWLGWGRTTLAVLAVQAAVPVTSTLVLGWLPGGWRPVGAAVWLVLGLSMALWLGRDQWRRARPRLGAAAATELLAGGEDAEVLVTGVDLAAWGERGAESRGASPALVEAQVERAARQAGRLDPAAALPADALWRWAGGVTLAAALLAGWLSWNPGGTRDAWLTLLLGGTPAPVQVGNLTLAVVPPAYTALPEGAVAGADGAVEGYPGTRVTLSGRLSRAVTSGQWEGPGGEVVALQLEGRRFSVGWLLQRAGTYRLMFFDGRRPVPSDFAPRPQSLREDHRPEVAMSEPAGDVEVTSDKDVEVVFRVTDDFRADRVELVASGETEVRMEVPVEPGKVVEGRARFLPLAHPELGEGAHLRLEAWDNDTVGGPKAGIGPSVYVAFLDKRRLLADIEGLQERLFEGLILHLGDHLENDSGAPTATLEPLRGGAGDLLALLDRLVEQVGRSAEEGALAAVAVLRIEAGLRQVLEPFAAGGDTSQPLIAEVERDILFLDRLLQSLRMEQTLSLGDEISSLQRDLFDALQNGTSPEDLVEQVSRIQQLLAEMASQLARSSGQMPDSFVNADAVQEMPASDMQQLLQELSAALQAGDWDAAQALAEKILETLSQWMAALEKAAGTASQGQLDPLLEELAALEEDTASLMADQESLLGDTQKVGQRASARAAEALQKELDAFFERQEQRLREIERQAQVMEVLAPRQGFHGAPPAGPPQTSAEAGNERLQLLEARRRVGAAANEVRNGLREDLGQARQGAAALEQSVGELAQGVERMVGAEPGRRQALDQARGVAEENLEALLAELDALGNRRLEGLDPGDREQLEAQGERQGELGDRAGELAERLQQLSEQTPLLGGEAAEGARGAEGSMRGAGGSLGQGDPFATVPQQGRALEQLAEVSQRLQGARQQMLEGMQGQGMQMLRSPGQRPGGGQDVDRSRVDIPREMEARELREFREQVLRAMREGRYPEEYREDVKRYYEGLIR